MWKFFIFFIYFYSKLAKLPKLKNMKKKKEKKISDHPLGGNSKETFIKDGPMVVYCLVNWTCDV